MNSARVHTSVLVVMKLEIQAAQEVREAPERGMARSSSPQTSTAALLIILKETEACETANRVWCHIIIALRQKDCKCQGSLAAY